MTGNFSLLLSVRVMSKYGLQKSLRLTMNSKGGLVMAVINKLSYILVNNAFLIK